MKPNQILSLLLCVIFFIIGLGASAILKLGFTPFSLNLFPIVGAFEFIFTAIDLLVLVLAVFIFSTLMFGFFACFVFLYLGLLFGSIIFENPLVVILNAIPLFIAAYIGILTGNYLGRDLHGRDNLFDHIKEIGIYLVVAVIVALIIGVLNPMIPNSQQMSVFFDKIWSMVL